MSIAVRTTIEDKSAPAVGQSPTWINAAGWIVRAMNTAGTEVYGARDNVLGVSTDDGATWTSVETFSYRIEAVLPLSDGEILVATSLLPANAGGERGRIYRSSGWAADHSTATFTQTLLVGTTAFAVFCSPLYGGLSESVKHPGWVLACEYGPQSSAVSGGNRGAYYLRLSTDYGSTWTTIFDLSAWCVTAGIDTATNPMHLHGACFDDYWDRIVLTFGDRATSTGEAGVFYLDYEDIDGVGTADWQPYFLTSENDGKWQSVAPIATKHALFLQSDGIPNGTRRIDRLGYRQPSTVQIGQIHDGVTGAAVVGNMPFKAPGENTPLLLPVGAGGGSTKKLARVVAVSAAGTVEQNLLLDDEASAASQILAAVGPTASGLIVGTSQGDGRYTAGAPDNSASPAAPSTTLSTFQIPARLDKPTTVIPEAEATPAAVPPRASGRTNILSGFTISNGNAVANNRLYHAPFYHPGGTITALGVDISTVGEAGSTARIAIHALNGNTEAGAVLAQTSAFAVDSGAGTGLESSTLASPLALDAGWYFYSVVIQNAPTTRPTLWTVTSSLASLGLRAVGGAGLAGASPQSYYVDGVTGAIPDTPSLSGTLNNMPRVVATYA